MAVARADNHDSYLRKHGHGWRGDESRRDADHVRGCFRNFEMVLAAFPARDQSCLTTPGVPGGRDRFHRSRTTVVDQRLADRPRNDSGMASLLQTGTGPDVERWISAPNQDTRSAWTLLENADATELAFLQARYPKMPKELKSVSWDEQALAVIIPSWSNFVGQYADLLKGLKVGDLFDSLGRIPQIAPQIRDPEGMLLTPEQRIERARSLLSVALGLCLVNHGWKLYTNPGELYLVSGNEQLNPLGMLLQLSDGDISKERWMEKCRELGIEGFLLVDGAQPIAASAV